MTEFNFILNFLDLVFLQGDLFGLRGEGPLGSADPLVKGMLPSVFGSYWLLYNVKSIQCRS